MTAADPDQPGDRSAVFAVVAAVLAIAVVAAVSLLLMRGDPSSESAASTPSASSSSSMPASPSIPTAAPSAPSASAPAQLSGQVITSEPSAEGSLKQVLLTDLATGRSQSVPVADSAYRAEVAAGSYAVAVSLVSAGESSLVTTSPGGAACDDLLVVRSGEQRSADLVYPCLAKGEPTSVAAAPPNPKIAEGLKAPTPQKIDRTDEFGEITRLKEQPAGSLAIEVDRVDWLSGAEAAAKDDRGAFPPNDYLAVNDNPQLRTYTIAPDATVWASLALPPKDVTPHRESVQALVNLFADRSPAGLQNVYWHLQVSGGMVVGVEEQYHP